jgi:glyoxylase-like metal-dependent hydrolase (beta-lactamase superfamily II)
LPVILRDLDFTNEHIVPLGSHNIRMYLIRGESYALLGGGVPWVVHLLEAQLDRYQIDRSRIRYLVISHVHHDHCGAVPYLLRRYPHIEVVASDYGAYLLGKSGPVELIRSVSRNALEKMNLPHQHDGISLNFESIPVSIRAGDGDCLDLGGGITLMFYSTPGHSRCSLSTYVPELKAIFPADALPFQENGSDRLIVTANHDYDDYIRSLEKLLLLPIAFIGYEHGGTITGADAATMVSRSLDATLQQRSRIRERFEELKDLELLVDEIAGKYHSLKFYRLVPADIMRAMTHRMVRSAIGMM